MVKDELSHKVWISVIRYILNCMDHISSHIRPAAKKSKITERGELMEYFLGKLNAGRVQDGLAPMTMGRMARVFVGIPTKDIYFLKSICDDAQKRNGPSAFSKKFWWEMNPKNHEKSSPKQN
jgi:hypothetical protein